VKASRETCDTLTPAESLVLDQLLTGRTTAEIARALFVTEATVRTHLTHIYGKLGVRGRVELLARLATSGEPNSRAGLARRLADAPKAPSPPAHDRGGVGMAVPGRSLTSGPGIGSVAIRALGLLALAFGLAHLTIAAWPLVGPALLAGQAVLTRRPDLLPTRVAMLVVGLLLSAEQLAVLVTLRIA
jgi:DNA-binding CsgD family transcriptional regulator